MSGSVYSWPSYRFFKRQVRWSDIPISFKSFLQFVVTHTVEEFSIINEAEVYICLELPCFLHDPMDVGNLTLASSKSRFYIWKFLVHVLLKSSLKDLAHNPTSMWNECNCTVIWTFFGITFLLDFNETWPFPVLWPLLSFPNLLAYWVQHFYGIIFQDLKKLNWNFITSTSFVRSDAS